MQGPGRARGQRQAGPGAGAHSGDLIAPPVSFKKIWTQVRGGAFNMWRPIAPKGFVSLGDIGTVSAQPPSTDDVVCVAESCLQGGVLKAQIWNDRGGGASTDAAYTARAIASGVSANAMPHGTVPGLTHSAHRPLCTDHRMPL